MEELSEARGWPATGSRGPASDLRLMTCGLGNAQRNWGPPCAHGAWREKWLEMRAVACEIAGNIPATPLLVKASTRPWRVFFGRTMVPSGGRHLWARGIVLAVSGVLRVRQDPSFTGDANAGAGRLPHAADAVGGAAEDYVEGALAEVEDPVLFYVCGLAGGPVPGAAVPALLHLLNGFALA